MTRIILLCAAFPFPFITRQVCARADNLHRFPLLNSAILIPRCLELLKVFSLVAVHGKWVAKYHTTWKLNTSGDCPNQTAKTYGERYKLVGSVSIPTWDYVHLLLSRPYTLVISSSEWKYSMQVPGIHCVSLRVLLKIHITRRHAQRSLACELIYQQGAFSQQYWMLALHILTM